MQTIARLVSSLAILALPTTMMGITLPLLTAAVSRQKESAGTSVSLLYALNTLGAMTGTLLAGYILIPAIGISGIPPGGDAERDRRRRRTGR